MNLQMNESRDGYQHRLLLFLRKTTKIPFDHIHTIKEGVWFLRAKRRKYILKKFRSDLSLSIQIQLTEALRKHRFKRTYAMYPTPLAYNDDIFGLIQYIPPSIPHPYVYNHNKNIVDALVLLNQFHETTHQLINQFTNKIPTFNQLEKWKKRFARYQQHLLNECPRSISSHLNTFEQLGAWSLKKMDEHEGFFTDQSDYIIHGDVASHNFLKSTNGALYIIDFDLVAISPKHIDLLQMANRILPYLEWDVEKLFRFPFIKEYKSNPTFLAALVYPTDIFREWIHFCLENEKVQTNKWPMMKRMILNQYKARLAFSKQIMSKVEQSNFPS